MSKELADDLVKRLARLPALPAVVQDILTSLDDEEMHADTFIHRVNTDPVLVARILATANSAVYGRTTPVASLKEALPLLGMNQLRQLILVTSLMQAFDKQGGAGFDRKNYWSHSFAVATCARTIAQWANENADTAYSAGLLHDIGHLLLSTVEPEKVALVYQDMETEQCSMIDAERTIMGIDHAELGLHMARHWQLPSALTEAIGLHHEPDKIDSPAALTDIVHVAEVLACALDLGTLPNSSVPPLSPMSFARLGLHWPSLARRFPEIEARFLSAAHFLED